MIDLAKQAELERFREMQVYEVLNGCQMKEEEDPKMISIKRVVTNKGTKAGTLGCP